VDQLFSILEKARMDDEIRNRFIQKYTPFILKVASETTNKFIDAGRDEEYSISLLAFNEAIDSFDSTRGVSFFTFARTIIHRRLIDDYRKKNKQNEIPMSVFEQKNQYVEYNLSIKKFGEEARQAERKDEILEYRRALEEFGISFDHLVKFSPRKKDARNRARDIARLIAKDRELTEYLMKKKLLPLKQLEQRTIVSRKTLERHRKYLIALVLILTGDYSYLKEYVTGGGKG